MTTRRPSIVAPVLLIAAGGACLSMTTGSIELLTLGNWYARWWPILLVAAGLMSLAEWWADRGTEIRRRHHWVLILALVLLGAAASHAEHGIHLAYHCAQWRF